MALGRLASEDTPWDWWWIYMYLFLVKNLYKHTKSNFVTVMLLRKQRTKFCLKTQRIILYSIIPYYNAIKYASHAKLRSVPFIAPASPHILSLCYNNEYPPPPPPESNYHQPLFAWPAPWWTAMLPGHGVLPHWGIICYSGGSRTTDAWTRMEIGTMKSNHNSFLPHSIFTALVLKPGSDQGELD